MKSFFFTIIIFLLSNYAYSQICFNYDAAGNRVSRKANLCPVLEDPGGNPTGKISNQSDEIKITDEKSEESISLFAYPNPTPNYIYLVTKGFPSTAKVIIFSINSSIVFQGNLGNGEFDLSSFKSGLYFVKVINDKQQRNIIVTKLD